MSEAAEAIVKKAHAEEELTRKEDFRALLGTREGRRWFWRYLTDSGLYASSFTGDALTGAFREGRRAQAVELMQEAQRVAPVKFLLMHEEATAAQRDLAQKLEHAVKEAKAAEE